MAVITLKDSNFEQEVLASETPCWWISGRPGARPAGCFPRRWTPSRRSRPAGSRSVRSTSTSSRLLAERFRVMSIPTLMVFKDGRLVDSTVGVQPKPAILRMLE